MDNGIGRQAARKRPLLHRASDRSSRMQPQGRLGAEAPTHTHTHHPTSFSFCGAVQGPSAPRPQVQRFMDSSHWMDPTIVFNGTSTRSFGPVTTGTRTRCRPASRKGRWKTSAGVRCPRPKPTPGGAAGPVHPGAPPGGGRPARPRQGPAQPGVAPGSVECILEGDMSTLEVDMANCKRTTLHGALAPHPVVQPLPRTGIASAATGGLQPGPSWHNEPSRCAAMGACSPPRWCCARTSGAPPGRFSGRRGWRCDLCGRRAGAGAITP